MEVEQGTGSYPIGRREGMMLVVVYSGGILYLSNVLLRSKGILIGLHFCNREFTWFGRGDKNLLITVTWSITVP